MFNDDEVRSALTKMYDYSPVDGFVEVSEGLADMMMSLANEPSVGLFYVQQHIHNAVPNIVDFRNKIAAKSREIALHTEDSEDSIVMVRSMADCGFPIVDEMIKDITKCLAIMSSRQPKKGLISSRSVSWGRSSWRGNVNQVEKPTTLLPLVFKSVKQNDNDGNWVAEEVANGSDTMLNAVEELPVSSCVLIGNEEEEVLGNDLILNPSGFESFDQFKVDKEARFEELLEGNGTQQSA